MYRIYILLGIRGVRSREREKPYRRIPPDKTASFVKILRITRNKSEKEVRYIYILPRMKKKARFIKTIYIYILLGIEREIAF